MLGILLMLVTLTIGAHGNPLPGTEDVELADQEVIDNNKLKERADLFGGDILGIAPNNHVGGNAWPNGIVPYEIHSSLSSHRSKITRAFEEYHSKTCVKFRPKTASDRAYIRLQNGQGCNSWIGRTGREQVINLQVSGCLQHGTIVHELGHAIGFHHTHQRSDRDNFIKINMENVDNSARSQFTILRGRNVVPYETTSIMHYSSYAFSSNRKPTIVTKSGGMIRDATGLSANDVNAIKILYKC